MNNKRGGFGTKLVLILILMLASAIAGAYGYRVLDGKMAIKDATKDVKDVDVADYDTAEATTIQEYINDALEDLEEAKSRQEVYEILTDFEKDVDRVQTKAEKEAAEALANQNSQNNSYNSNNNSSNSNNNSDDSSSNTDDSSSGSNGLFNFKSDDSAASSKKKSN